MRVICIDNGGGMKAVTIGKVYEVVSSDSRSYTIRDDKGMVGGFYKTRFHVVDDMPASLVAQAVSQPTRKEQEQDLSDWRVWQHKAPGECVCGIPRTACDYHR